MAYGGEVHGSAGRSRHRSGHIDSYRQQLELVERIRDALLIRQRIARNGFGAIFEPRERRDDDRLWYAPQTREICRRLLAIRRDPLVDTTNSLEHGAQHIVVLLRGLKSGTSILQLNARSAFLALLLVRWHGSTVG